MAALCSSFWVQTNAYLKAFWQTVPHPFCPPRSWYLLILYSINIPILYKKVNRNRPNQLFSILPVKIPVVPSRITSPSAYSPLRPDTHSKIPLQGCWDGFRAIRHNALFFQFFFNQCRTACSMPKGISLNIPFISIIIFSLKHKLPPFIPYRCFSSIYPLFCSPIQSASWDGAFHPASPEYPSCIPAAAAPQYDLL